VVQKLGPVTAEGLTGAENNQESNSAEGVRVLCEAVTATWFRTAVAPLTAVFNDGPCWV